MGRVHPNPDAAVAPAEAEQGQPEPAVVLTVWRKSLLFGCDGFTVFDARGDLAFRVDCYASPHRRRAEVVLMGAAGEPLLTVRRARRLGGVLASERWVIYDGDAASGSTAKPLLSVRRHHSGSKALAHVTPLVGASGAEAAYVVEGSYARRACAVRDARGGAVAAEVRRKESVGDDVFRLVVPGARLGAPLAMGLVIALDEMFAGRAARSALLRRTWSATA